MSSFDEFWEESERNPTEEMATRIGWDAAYVYFRKTGQVRFVQGSMPFSVGYNACMRTLEKNPLESHIYKMIRATESNIRKFSRLSGAESTLSLLQLELETYKLALKQYTGRVTS